MTTYRITNRKTGVQFEIDDNALANKGINLNQWLTRKSATFGADPIVATRDTSAEGAELAAYNQAVSYLKTNFNSLQPAEKAICQVLRKIVAELR